MKLIPLPTDEEIRTLHKFPYNEGRHYEFKSSIQCPKGKVLPTLCGFLNVGGGHMIFGVADNLNINGFTATTKDLDTFLLFVDNIVRNSHIVKGINNETIAPEQLTSRLIHLDDTRHVLIISVSSDEGIRYQIKDGTVYYRLNASNYRVTTDRYFTESQVTMMIRDRTHLLHNEYQGVVSGMEKEIVRMSEIMGIRNKMLEESRRSTDRVIADLSETNRLLTERILYDKVAAERRLKRRSWFGC
jgi:hypothetical protein